MTDGFMAETQHDALNETCYHIVVLSKFPTDHFQGKKTLGLRRYFVRERFDTLFSTQ